MEELLPARASRTPSWARRAVGAHPAGDPDPYRAPRGGLRRVTALVGVLAQRTPRAPPRSTPPEGDIGRATAAAAALLAAAEDVNTQASQPSVTLATDQEILAARAHRAAGLERAALIACASGAEPVLAPQLDHRPGFGLTNPKNPYSFYFSFFRNLATFVTTWMEPEAQRVIAENLHRNFIDHAEYPQTAEIEQRCIRMLADLFHAPGETTGARTQGSSEAIMLGALSLKWKWRERREAAGKPTRPAEPGVRRRRARRVGEVLPLLRRRAADRPAAGGQVHDRPRGRRAARRREHDRRRRRARHHLHRPRRRHRRHQRPARRPEATTKASTSRCTSTAPAAASCGRSSTPTPSGTSASSRCARSTSPATSSGSSTRVSAG